MENIYFLIILKLYIKKIVFESFENAMSYFFVCILFGDLLNSFNLSHC